MNKDVPPYMTVRGPSVIRGINLVGLRRAGFKREVIREVKEVYKIMFLSGATVEEALDKIKSSFTSDAIEHFISFVKASKRGICKMRFNKEEYFD